MNARIPLEEGAIEALSNSIKLRCVMDGELPCRTCCCKVLVEGSTEVFTSAVGTQDLDHLAMPLRDCPCLEGLVVFEGVALLPEEKGHCVAHGVVRE